ncbi:ISAs1 family transposase [Micromonospora globispora]|uniref:ISAs1 family transposase n=1 Tax=Micromonospora globispora TaxID=1450148 RepID=UPI001FAECDBB|nr:ISAs1 family transposase [Micromonospora globispora]
MIIQVSTLEHRRVTPVGSSSLIDVLAAHADRTPTPVVPQDRVCSLVTALAQVPDRRDPRGVGHVLSSVLAVAVAAVLAGARSVAAIGEWAADLPQRVLADLSVFRDPFTGVYRPPVTSTIRRVLVDVDADALDTAVSRWIIASAASTGGAPGRQAYSVDGKTLRGSGRTGGQRHLLAVLEQHTGVVVGQIDVDGRTNEITRFRPLLEGLDLTGAVVAADALHTQREHARWLVDSKASAYLCTVKNNQPGLYRQS